MLTQDASQDDQASSIVPTSVAGPIPSSSAPTFTFDGEEHGDTIVVDSTPIPDREPVRPTKIEVIIPRKPAVTKLKASLSSISQEEHTSPSENGEIEVTIPRRRAVTKRKASLSSISQEEHALSSEDDEPIRIHRYKRIRVKSQSSIISSSSPSIATRFGIHT